jgi:hypothetical protein
MTPPKAEYIGADQLPFFIFRLQLYGGPYIPISGLGPNVLDQDMLCRLRSKYKSIMFPPVK